MKITKISGKTMAPVAPALVAILLASFAIAPLAIAASPGSDYPMEVTRAHTVYIIADPATTVSVGLGVYGNR